MVRLVCVEGGSSKFWEGAVEGDVFTVRFGKLGTAGQTQTKKFASAAAAEKALAKKAAEKRAKGYAEEAGAKAAAKAGPATAPPAKRPTKKAAAAASWFPFLFYGARAGDYSDGFSYELRFQKTLDKKTRTALAVAFEAALAERGGTWDASWKWSGPWALVEFGDCDPTPLLKDLEVVIEAVHGVAPLDQAIFIEAEATSAEDAWTAWSLAQRAAPAAGPTSGTTSPLYERDDDPELPRYAADAAFDQAQIADSRARVAAAAKREGEVRDAALALVPCDRSKLPAVRIPEVLAPYLEDSGFPKPVPQVPRPRRAAALADGTGILVVDEKALFRVSAKGTERLWQATAGDNFSVAGLPDGLAAVLGREGLVLLDTAHPKKPIHTLPVGGYHIHAVLGGRLLVVLLDGVVAVVAVIERRLTLLGRLKLKAKVRLMELREGDGIFLPSGNSDTCYELVGAEAAWHGVAGHSSGQRAATIELASVPKLPRPVAAPKAKTALLGLTRRPGSTVGPGGRVVGLGLDQLGVTENIGWIDDAGKPQRWNITGWYRGFGVSPDGATMVAATWEKAFVRRLADGTRAPEVIWDSAQHGAESIVGVAWAAGDRVAVLDEVGLHLIDRKGKLVAKHELAAGEKPTYGSITGRCASCHDGRVIVALSWQAPHVNVFGVFADRVAPLASFEVPVALATVYDVGGRIVLAGARGEGFELQNTLRAWEAGAGRASV